MLPEVLTAGRLGQARMPLPGVLLLKSDPVELGLWVKQLRWAVHAGALDGLASRDTASNYGTQAAALQVPDAHAPLQVRWPGSQSARLLQKYILAPDVLRVQMSEIFLGDRQVQWDESRGR